MDDNMVEGGSQPENTEKNLSTHPLLIPVIIDIIIKYSPFHVLKTCRLICKLWNETVSSSKQFKLKSRNFVEFGYREKYDVINISHPLHSMDRLSDCIRSPLRNGNFPLHTFIVTTSGTRIDSNLEESTLVNFLNAIGPVAQKIVIQHDYEFATRGQCKTANWSVYPKLKYVKLSLSKPQIEIICSFLGHLMQEGNSPQLEKLHIHWEQYAIPESTVSKLISTINVPTTTSKLKSLKMKSPLQLQQLIEFSALELHLREFHIEIGNISYLGVASTVRSILEKQSNTLSILKIIDWQKGYQRLERKWDLFPILPNLEALSIYTEKIIFTNISLNETFPRLKSLIFTGTKSPWDDFFGTVVEPTLSVNELGITRRLEDEVILVRAVQHFPKVRKLQIPALSKMTKVVFDKMSQIEDLTLDTTDIRCIDDIITGMTLKECEDYLGRMTDWRKNIEVLASIRDVRLTTKPISCLTKLKILRLFSMDYEIVKNSLQISREFRRRKVEITKLSYLMVLLNMDSLRCIDFGERFFPPSYQLQPSVWKRVSEKCKILCRNRWPDDGYRS